MMKHIKLICASARQDLKHVVTTVLGYLLMRPTYDAHMYTVCGQLCRCCQGILSFVKVQGQSMACSCFCISVKSSAENMAMIT